jgi:hypothetical protein
MKNTKKPSTIFFLFMGLLLMQCSSGENSNTSEPLVNWSNYDKNVKDRIIVMANNKDCQGLQNEFNLAEQNSDSQRNRVGEGNLNLMNYIDFKMKKCNCYK